MNPPCQTLEFGKGDELADSVLKLFGEALGLTTLNLILVFFQKD